MASFLPKTRLPAEPPPRWFWISSLSLLLLGIVFFALSLVVGDRQSRLFLAVIPVILICALALHAYYLLHAGRERHVTEASLRQSQELLQEVTNHVQEVVWMLRADTNELVYVSNAYEAVTGHSLRAIRENPSSYKDLVDPEDRARFLAKLEEARTTGKFDQEFRIVRADGVSRWIWSKGTRAGDARDVPPRIVGIAQDVTERKQAELDIAKHLAAAEAARAEAEALRLSTLTLTKNLSMDMVLDTLMASLLEVVPYESASVILTEDDCLYVARTPAKTVQMLEGQQNTLLERVRVARKCVFVPDSRRDRLGECGRPPRYALLDLCAARRLNRARPLPPGHHRVAPEDGTKRHSRTRSQKSCRRKGDSSKHHTAGSAPVRQLLFPTQVGLHCELLMH